ncbi:hypothetical protein HDU97_008039 [Phlyctochytrium planicorne]|nr:hypothetical protein HDU97_008039 [Phlyctochytrium planicorne]
MSSSYDYDVDAEFHFQQLLLSQLSIPMLPPTTNLAMISLECQRQQQQHQKNMNFDGMVPMLPLQVPSNFYQQLMLAQLQLPIAEPQAIMNELQVPAVPVTNPIPPFTFADEDGLLTPQTLMADETCIDGQFLSIPNEISFEEDDDDVEIKKEPDCNMRSLPPVNLSKTSTSEDSRCYFCSDTLGVLIFYPDSEGQLSHNPIDVACMSCVDKQLHLKLPSARWSSLAAPMLSDQEEADLSLKKRRAKGIRTNQTLYCEACNRKIGFGGVRATSDNDQHVRVHSEPICANCVYFCTQCGGGGTFRTGKWRPRQLFEDGRKTCRLSHDRMGAIGHFQVTTYKCPSIPIEDRNGRLVDSSYDPSPIIAYADGAITEQLEDPSSSIFRVPRGRNGSAKSLAAFNRFSSASAATASGVEVIRRRRDQFLKMNELRLMAYWATPAFMASYDGLVGSWEKLEAYSDDWNRQLNDFMVGAKSNRTSRSRPDGSRRFIVVTDSLRAGKKATTKKGADEFDLLLVGYFFFDWNPSERTVHLSQMYYDGKDSLLSAGDSDSNTPLPYMFGAMVKRIQAERAADGMLPEPQHVLVTMPKAALAERNRMAQHVEKKGFLPLDRYCQRNCFEIRDLQAKFALGEHQVPGMHDQDLMTKLAIKWTELKRKI